MNKINCLLKLFTIFTVLFCGGKTRKYNVEDESMKLYGEDFKSVLKRFRRTPDYLKILEDKKQDLMEHVDDLTVHLLAHFDGKLNEKVREMLKSSKEETTTPGNAAKYYRRFWRNPLLPDIGDMWPPRLREGDHHKHDNKTGVEKLDGYSKLTSPLTLQERNTFKDLGFEYAGKVIHTIIKNFAGDDYEEKSTRIPGGAFENHFKPPPTTTEHFHDVITTNPSTQGDGAPDDTFRYKHRAPGTTRILQHNVI